MAKDGLQEKLADLIRVELASEDNAIKDLALFFLMLCEKKRDIVSMKNAVKTMMDAELEKQYKYGLLEYDEDDDKYDLIK